MNLGASKFGGISYGGGDVEIDYLLIGGGGAGSFPNPSEIAGAKNGVGGGGAGGFISSYSTALDKLFLIRGKTYDIRIGRGGNFTGAFNALYPEPDARWGLPSTLTGEGFVGLVAQGGGEYGYGAKGFAQPDTGKTFVITNVQKTNGTVRITTSTAHGLSTYLDVYGQTNSSAVHIRDVGGITEVNNVTMDELDGSTVVGSYGWFYNVIDSTTIDLYDSMVISDGNKVNTSGWGSYTSGGTLQWTVRATGGSNGAYSSEFGVADTGGTYPGTDPYHQASGAGAANSYSTTAYAGGSGGGGGSSADGTSTLGGAGTANSITGSSVTYGVGGTYDTGTATTGYGDGGRAGQGGNNGVVIIRMNSAAYSGITTGSPTVTVSGLETVLTYTSSGTYTA